LLLDDSFVFIHSPLDNPLNYLVALRPLVRTTPPVNYIIKLDIVLPDDLELGIHGVRLDFGRFVSLRQTQAGEVKGVQGKRQGQVRAGYMVGRLRGGQEVKAWVLSGESLELLLEVNKGLV
jgi:hypothetical protein